MSARIANGHLYQIVGEVELVHATQPGARPSQPTYEPRSHKNPKEFRIGTRLLFRNEPGGLKFAKKYGAFHQVRAWPIFGQGSNVGAIPDAELGHDSKKDKDIKTGEDSGSR